MTTTAPPVTDAARGRASLRSLGALRRLDHRGFVIGLVVCTLAGAAVRLMNVLWWRPTTSRPGFLGYVLAGDASYYHWQANAIADGQWFVDPYLWANRGESVASAAHAPLYTLYLSFWSALGVDTVTGHRLASCLLGVAAVTLIGLLAFRLAGRAAGLLGAGIAALYPGLWINDGMLLAESIAIVAMVCALHAMYSFWRTPTTRNAVVLGLTCAVAGLARTELLALFAVALVPLALTIPRETWGERLKRAVVGCVAGALLIAPWAIFNLTRFEEPTLTTTGFGAALSAASCDAVFYGDRIGYYDNCFDGPWPSPDLDESQRDAYSRDAALEYTEEHLSRLPVVAAARIGRIWGVFKPGQTTSLDWSVEGRGRAPSWIALFSYYVLVITAVGGLVRLVRHRVTILPLLAAPIIVTFAAATTFGVTRYRAPAEVAIVVAAAVGIAALARRGRDDAADRGGGDGAPVVPEAEDRAGPAGTLAQR